MRQSELAQRINQTLEIQRFEDYGPNGVQVEGDDRQVQKLALAVSLTEEVIDQAIAWNADLLVVHHGIYWKGQSSLLQGPFRRKAHKLLNHGLAALAYHLPLDFHPLLGNNAQFAAALGLTELKGILPERDYFKGVLGKWNGGTVEALATQIQKILGQPPKVLHFAPGAIQHVAIVTGGGQSYFEAALQAGADCFITGEASEYNYATAQEWQRSMIAAGHYASEQLGIQALGQWLHQEIGVETRFFRTLNPC